jgi:hypothetical protein
MTKKILYGTRNFEAVTADNGYYVDKTKFIEKLESLGANFEVFFDSIILTERFIRQYNVGMSGI